MAGEEYQPGDALAGYEVLGHLGTVGLCDRYRVAARDGRELCAGVLPVTNSDVAEHLRGMGLERLHHPNLWQLLDVGLAGSRPVLVGERIAGRTLRDELSEGPLAPRDASAVARDLLEGLAAAHAAGFVHRDVRPETILVERGPSGLRAKIVDLGVAGAIFELVSTGRSVTTSGHTIGRPHYWAPERARRPAQADARADLFSFGCVLYELHVGRSPFQGLNLYDCYHATLEEKYEPLPATVPDPVRLTVGALLRAKAADRPQGCNEVLELLAGSRDAPARSLAGSPPLSAPMADPRRAWLIGGAVGALVTAGIAAAAWLALGR
jgi:eukaryotic-like serine/threonine-protein kinase